MIAARGTVADLFEGELVERGQQEFADRMRIVVASREPFMAAALEGSGDDVFLEPLVFAYAVSSGSPVGLPEIVFGRMNPSARPREIDVYADRDGIVTLPGIGYLGTRVRDRKLRLTWNNGVCDSILHVNDSIVPYAFEEPIYIDKTGVELSLHHHPLLDRFFVEAGEPASVSSRGLVAKHRNHLEKAFRIIAESVPDYYEQILKVTRRIFLYSSPQPYSFTALAAHGMAFPNVSRGDDEVFFIEDLIHQCGHLLFSALTPEPSMLFRIPADTPLCSLNGNADDHRDIYTALHGVFTEAWMNLGFHNCCDNHSFNVRQKHELLGRFALILTRFGSDFRSIAHKEVFTPAGLQLLEWFFEVYREIAHSRHAQLSRLDISNQPYCFNYERFVQVNPLPGSVPEGMPGTS